MAEKISKKSMFFFQGKAVSSALKLSTKLCFSLDRYELEIWVENIVLAIEHEEIDLFMKMRILY